MRFLFQQFGPGHQEAGDAVAALDRVRVDEGLLQGMQARFMAARPGGQALDRHDVRAVRPRRRHQAGHDGHAVQEDGAGAALTFGAAFLGAGQQALFAQPAQQRLAAAPRARSRHGR